MTPQRKSRGDVDAAITGGETPDRLASDLSRVVEANIRSSVMIWGAPGIGKSSVVAQVAAARNLRLVDLRLSQLAPTDLRGLPVAANGVARWYPPEFLPRKGKGILFLDEINMAPPAIQGIAQQLILDRRVGSYEVPDGWFIWAAGNRQEDRASVFAMPAPLANRFIHFEVRPEFESFKLYALRTGIDETVLSFLAFRPQLLHRFDEGSAAWPSPRSWEMASHLQVAGLAVHPAVGHAAASEFAAYREVYLRLPDLDAICAGTSSSKFPAEPSARYAIVIGLAVRAKSVSAMRHSLVWVTEHAPAEWQSAFLVDLTRRAREGGLAAGLATAIRDTPALSRRLVDIRNLLLQ